MGTIPLEVEHLHPGCNNARAIPTIAQTNAITDMSRDTHGTRLVVSLFGLKSYEPCFNPPGESRTRDSAFAYSALYVVVIDSALCSSVSGFAEVA